MAGLPQLVKLALCGSCESKAEAELTRVQNEVAALDGLSDGMPNNACSLDCHC